MKLRKRVAALAVILSGCLATPTTLGATIDIGSGPENSHFVLESPNLGIRTYQIHYGDGGAPPPSPLDGYGLLSLILAFEPDLTATFFNFGTAESSNYIVNELTYKGVTETNNSTEPWVPSWTHWVAGGEAGFPSAEPIAGDSWLSGFGISAPYRLVASGSWDALVFADFTTPPSGRPIPEPQGLLLLVLGSLLLGGRRRHHAR